MTSESYSLLAEKSFDNPATNLSRFQQNASSTELVLSPTTHISRLHVQAGAARSIAFSPSIPNQIHSDVLSNNLLQTQERRLICCFGLLPNFEPEVLLGKLSDLLSEGEYLLLSANFSPGTDYAAGLKQVFPLYDNALTRDWLFMFLSDLGVERGDGEVKFSIQKNKRRPVLSRIQGDFVFKKKRTISVEDKSFTFRRGEGIRLFYSYRYNIALTAKLLAEFHFVPIRSWITRSMEEAVILCERRS